MTRNFARYEQFLRIFALLDILAAARQPLDDKTLIGMLKERLGLSKLSTRTLHRDCEFLVACGYPITHEPLPGDRRFGWSLDRYATGRKLPPEGTTILELVAFRVAREMLRALEGTILWTGIEALRQKIESGLTPQLLGQVEEAGSVFSVRCADPARYAARPRLLSALGTAITDRREIELETRSSAGQSAVKQRVQPISLVIRLPKVQLLGWHIATGSGDRPILVDIDVIEKVMPLDVTFEPRPIDPDSLPGDAGV
ncbi:MAG: hypothetical protein EBR23_06130 [Planctomycetia bacterium]|nr:hypothetical protein [Planctomycetia bacterium]